MQKPANWQRNELFFFCNDHAFSLQLIPFCNDIFRCSKLWKLLPKLAFVAECKLFSNDFRCWLYYLATTLCWISNENVCCWLFFNSNESRRLATTLYVAVSLYVQRKLIWFATIKNVAFYFSISNNILSVVIRLIFRCQILYF